MQQVALVIMILFVLPLSRSPGWLILKGRKSLGMAGLMSRILAACAGTEYFLTSLIPRYLHHGENGPQHADAGGCRGISISKAALAITTSFVGQNKPGIAAAAFLLFSTQVPIQPRLGVVLDRYANEQTLGTNIF